MPVLSAVHTRPAIPDDAFLAVLLRNSVSEPHFHSTAAKLAAALSREDHGYVVAEQGGRLQGLGSLWLPDFHPFHGWVGLNLHPDHREDGTAQSLLERLSARARAAGRTHLWTSVREDYLPAQPDLPALGFREVHRTFGGGFHLKGWQADTRWLEAGSAERGYRLEPAAPWQGDARLSNLYAVTREDKVSAPPTIPPAGETVTDDDGLWQAAFAAWHGDELVGLAVPERSGLGAWNAVLTVHPQHRRRGLGTALLAHVARRLQAEGMGFLNVAGSARDRAYLGVLRRLGANIEPDWTAWEREA
ncbi:GNAT family N-acetyltransferase [Deinococcus hopiensis]|uniref:Predicted acetyltransferase n=1 Tax=Deinococcus hopiensis KR-140 TaxID=695939 RepID=A0A1W1VS97_9DEIO|nr:GNAT family N-acetyltransferase [Deinococcus hopiensis]SMB96252.1 Predicted acetyltransferase [Deinococcus hopiensis KR-140]